jgi:hypothetical protein
MKRIENNKSGGDRERERFKFLLVFLIIATFQLGFRFDKIFFVARKRGKTKRGRSGQEALKIF